VVDGLIVAERGARVTGRIADARRAGRMSGVSSLELRLLDVTTADGQRIAVSCDAWLKRSDSLSRDAKPVTIPSETVIRFRLASRVTITERRL
jgi:YD repeat-containing protein